MPIPATIVVKIISSIAASPAIFESTVSAINNLSLVIRTPVQICHSMVRATDAKVVVVGVGNHPSRRIRHYRFRWRRRQFAAFVATIFPAFCLVGCAYDGIFTLASSVTNIATTVATRRRS